uniref:Putative ovule protein n=1 Tax=Solanum chacoense TaxID=4108 RepID=A0A0V0H779_SOLCH
MEKTIKKDTPPLPNTDIRSHKKGKRWLKCKDLLKITQLNRMPKILPHAPLKKRTKLPKWTKKHLIHPLSKYWELKLVLVPKTTL